MVPQEHHGFLAQLVGNIHHFLGQGSHLPALEGLEVLKFPGGNPVLIVVVALVNNEFRAELVANFLLKLLQDVGRHGGGVAVPVNILFPLQLVKHQGELMEEGGVADDIDIGVICNELTQPLHGELVGLGLTNIKGDLVFKVLPVIGDCIIHVDRIPDQVGQECHGILMEGFRLGNYNTAGFCMVVPSIRGDRPTDGTIHDFPPALDVVTGIDFHQLRGNALHQRDLQSTLGCGMEAGHDVALLHFLGIGFCPGIVLTGGVVGGVNLCILILQLGREIGAVAVTDGICTPALHDFQSLGNHIQVGGNCNTASVDIFIHFGKLLTEVNWCPDFR